MHEHFDFGSSKLDRDLGGPPDWIALAVMVLLLIGAGYGAYQVLAWFCGVLNTAGQAFFCPVR